MGMILDVIKQLVGVFQSFGVEWKTLIYAIINFTIVLVVLKVFAVKPFQDLLEKRRKLIADSVDNAATVEKQLQQANEEKARIISEANATANSIIESAKANANSVKERLISEATAEATHIKEKADTSSKMEHDKLMKSAKAEIANLVMSVTQSVVGRTLTADDQARINKESTSKI